MITGEQCRAARALLRWSQSDLAERTSISTVTIRNFELGRSVLKESTARLVRFTFQDAGVVFLDPDDEGPGARLAKPVD